VVGEHLLGDVLAVVEDLGGSERARQRRRNEIGRPLPSSSRSTLPALFYHDVRKRLGVIQ
jgi:hypothetical protein